MDCHFFIRRISFDQVPREEEESTKFLNKLYQEKVKITVILSFLKRKRERDFAIVSDRQTSLTVQHSWPLPNVS